MTAYEKIKAELSDPKTHAQLALAMQGANFSDVPMMQFALKFLGAVQIQRVQWGPGILEYVYSAWVEGTVFIFWRGLQDLADWVQTVLASNQVPCVQQAGQVSQMASNIALAGVSYIDGDLAAALAFFGTASLDLVVIGHSQGGASATAFFTQRPAPLAAFVSGKLLITYASPRCLDPQGSAAFPIEHVQVAHARDPVPHVPPLLWFAGYPPFLPTSPSPYIYAANGTHYLIDDDQRIEETSFNAPAFDNGFTVIGGGFVNLVLNQEVHDLGYISALLSGSRDRLGSTGSKLNFSRPSLPRLGVPGMPIFKATYFFKQGPYGWTENFFLSESTLTAAYIKATSVDLIVARMNLLAVSSNPLASQPILAQIRVSNTDRRRDAKILIVAPPAVTSSAVYADIPNSALLVRWVNNDGGPTTSNLYSSRTFLKGFDDSLIANGGQFNPSTGFTTAFNTWVGRVVDKALGSLFVSKEETVIQNVSLTNAAPNLDIVTAVNHGFATGDYVDIQGVVPAGLVRGVFRVVVLTPTSYRINGLTISGAYTWPGTSNLWTKVFKPIESGQVLRATHRIAGRPFDSPRGRRRRPATA